MAVTPALAQEPPAGPPAGAVQAEAGQAEEDPLYEEENGDEAIVVTGQRERGSVVGDIPPEIQLRPGDIRAYGASNLAELLEALEPQTQSSRGREGGRPVMLLNGRRISGFSEIRDIPPEAVVRVDILPEEVALKYGYPADQKVVNFVLRERFRAVTAEAEYGEATEGGRSLAEMDLNILRIAGEGRWNLDAEYGRETMLLESERDLVGDLGQFRSLLPESDRLALNGTYSRMLGDVSATANTRFEVSRNESRVGIDDFDLRPLERESDSRSGHLGLAFNGAFAPWQWSLTGNLDRAITETDTERNIADPLLAVDHARSTSDSGDAEIVLSGPLLDLPAGDVTTSLKAGVAAQALDSESVRAGVAVASDLSRRTGDAQASLDIPIADRRRGVLPVLGDLSANLNLAARHLSDFGMLTTWGGGVHWSPLGEVDLIASFTDEDGAPSMQQLGDPVVATPNVQVFDFTTGETVEIIRVEGGNPGLIADSRRVMKLGATVKPLAETDLTLSANYTSSRIRDAISSFPAITAEVEAAFPERFLRDAAGDLLRVDTRPVNFAHVDRQDIRWGINYSKRLGPEPRGRGGDGPRRDGPPREGGQSGPGGQGAGGQGPGGGGFGRFRGGPGGFGGPRGGRLQLSLYHTWRLEDSILIRPGVPELDLLNGSAAGNSGGTPRHEIEFRAGLFKDGYGARLSTNWQSGTTVDGGPDGTGGSTSDLQFSDLATVDLRLFADLGQQRALVRDYPWVRGMRLSLDIENLFDSRIRVRDENGLTPISYQPAFLDPLGRSVTLSLRKLFF